MFYVTTQLRKAYNRQIEEIKNLRNELVNSEKRICELELEIKRLQINKI